MSGIKKERKSKDFTWMAFTGDEYIEAIDQMVHQSFKTTNTNSKAGGVRIGHEQAVKLPYVSARSLLSTDSKIRMDRVHGMNKAVICGQIQKADTGDVPEEALADAKLIQSKLAQTRASSNVICSSLSPRIRQIFLPKDDGDYVCISPLSVAGVSHLLKEAIKAHNDTVFSLLKNKSQEAVNLRLIPLANMPIGGANPFNGGDLILPMRSPICIEAPCTTYSMKKLFSLFYKGADKANIPAALSREYIQWRNHQKGITGANLEVREQHVALIRRISRHLLALAKDAREILDSNIHLLPDGRPYSHSLSDFQKGLLDTGYRTNKWQYDYASYVAKKISRLENDAQRQFEYSQDELNTISSIVRGTIQ